MTLFGILAASSSALAIAPFMPFGALGQDQAGAEDLEDLARSVVIVSGIVRMSFRPLAAATNARAMPVLPLVGSIRTVSLLMRPLFRASSIIAIADAVLDAREGVEELELEQDLGLRAVGGCGAVEAHERRVADRFGDVVVYLGHVYCGLSFGFGKKGRGLDRVVLVEGVGLPEAQADEVVDLESEVGELRAGDLHLDMLARLHLLEEEPRLRARGMDVADDGGEPRAARVVGVTSMSWGLT
jgi:hypothetical protein